MLRQGRPKDRLLKQKQDYQPLVCQHSHLNLAGAMIENQKLRIPLLHGFFSSALRRRPYLPGSRASFAISKAVGFSHKPIWSSQMCIQVRSFIDAYRDRMDLSLQYCLHTAITG